MNPDDMGESPLHENDTRFQPGVSGNPNGRPKGKGKPRSKMRSQLVKMCDLQPDALEILRISMTGKNSKGEKVDMPSKEKIEMAKFIVNKIESLNNTCLREEMNILSVRNKGDTEGASQLESNQQEAPKATASGAFSLDMASETQH